MAIKAFYDFEGPFEEEFVPKFPRKEHRSPEKEFFVAIMLDAVEMYRRGRQTKEIEKWLKTEDEYPSAFGIICYYLKLDPEAVRKAFENLKPPEKQPRLRMVYSRKIGRPRKNGSL